MNQPAGLTLGPEMDARVAECLGWTHPWCDKHPEGSVGEHKFWYGPNSTQPLSDLPAFSTDDAVAFVNLWPWLCERSHPILYGSRTLDDTVVQVMTNRGWEEAVEPTVALALCKAVLVVHESAKEQR